MIKQRIKMETEKGVKVIGYMVADEVSQYENIVGIGISVCHESDKFDKNFGEKLAHSRATDFNKYYKIKNIENWFGCSEIENQLENFVKRCVQYYKDKGVITPKVIFV